MVVSYGPEKVQESDSHSGHEGDVGWSIHHRAKGIEEIAQNQAVFTKKVQSVLSVVVSTHQGKEEKWSHVYKAIRNGFKGRFSRTL